MSGASLGSLGSAGQTPRVNHYLLDMRPTTLLHSIVRGGGSRQSTTAAVSRDFRAPSPLAHDPATGKVVVVPRYSRPTSAASDVTNLSQMNPMAVRLTPLGAVFGGEVDDSMHDDEHMRLVTEVYLDEMLDDPVPFDDAHLAPVTPSTPSQVDSPPPSSGLSPHVDPAQALPAETYQGSSSEEEETTATELVQVPGLTIQLSLDVLSVSKRLDAFVLECQHSISEELRKGGQDSTAAQVQHVAAMIPGVVNVQIVFVHTPTHDISRTPSNASSSKRGGKGWNALRRRSSQGSGQGAQRAGEDGEGSGAFERMKSCVSSVGGHNSHNSVTGGVLKGGAARRVRNDCISRAAQVWEASIPHYVQMRSSQVDLLLPFEPPSSSMMPLPPSSLAQLESLSVGVLVQVREGAPPLALLAAGVRAGVGTVVRCRRPARNSKKGWEVEVWWHLTGLLTRHSSDVNSAECYAALAVPGTTAHHEHVGRGGRDGEGAAGGEGSNRWLLGTDCLLRMASKVGVHVSPEPGLLVQRRRHPPASAWATSNVSEEGYVVSEELGTHTEHALASLVKRRRMCYVVWKHSKQAAGGTGDWAMKSEKGNEEGNGGSQGSVGHRQCVKLKDLSGIKVPSARLAALLRSDEEDQGRVVGSPTCPLAIGLRVQVSRRAYAMHTEYAVISSDGPGVIVGLYSAQGAPGDTVKEGTSAADTSTPASQTGLSTRNHTLQTRYHTVQIAWLRTSEVQTCPRWLIEDSFLVEAETERVVGSSQWPAAVGMRVRFMDRMRFLAPIIYSDSGARPAAYVCMYVCMYACIYIYVCMHACMYTHMYVCMYVCMCMHACTYTHTQRESE